MVRDICLQRLTFGFDDQLFSTRISLYSISDSVVTDLLLSPLYVTSYNSNVATAYISGMSHENYYYLAMATFHVMRHWQN